MCKQMTLVLVQIDAKSNSHCRNITRKVYTKILQYQLIILPVMIKSPQSVTKTHVVQVAIAFCPSVDLSLDLKSGSDTPDKDGPYFL